MPGGSFKPGDKVPTTGIYTAIHERHRLPHQVFAVEGDEFPECRKCGFGISFALVQTAGHIERDQDFSRVSTATDENKKAGKGGKKTA